MQVYICSGLETDLASTLLHAWRDVAEEMKRTDESMHDEQT
jgi:hypothetical protein